jgi:hypothetical protein
LVWTLGHPAVAAAVVDGATGAVEFRLSELDVEDIQAAIPDP